MYGMGILARLGTSDVGMTFSYTVEDHCMCEGVQSSDPWDPIGRKTNFSGNTNIYSWVKLVNVTTAYRAKWEFGYLGYDGVVWRAPLYYDIPAPPAGYIWAWYKVWAGWSDIPATEAGVVDFYLGSITPFRDFFTVGTKVNIKLTWKNIGIKANEFGVAYDVPSVTKGLTSKTLNPGESTTTTFGTYLKTGTNTVYGRIYERPDTTSSKLAEKSVTVSV